MTTPTRLALLEAVAEAAALWRNPANTGHSYILAVAALTRAVDALRTHDAAQPAAEVAGEWIEITAYVRLDDTRRAYIVSGMGALSGRWQEKPTGNTIATITARVPLPSIPVIAADVEVK